MFGNMSAVGGGFPSLGGPIINSTPRPQPLMAQPLMAPPQLMAQNQQWPMQSQAQVPTQLLGSSLGQFGGQTQTGQQYMVQPQAGQFVAQSPSGPFTAQSQATQFAARSQSYQKPPATTAIGIGQIQMMSKNDAVDKEPEDPFADSQFAVYETPSDASDSEGGGGEGRKKGTRSRKGRRSRSHDRRDRDRDRKKRRRSRRSRSRSRSRGPGSGNKVFLNPALGKYGGSVSGLLDQVNKYEEQVKNMTQESQQLTTRVRSLEVELENLRQERMRNQSELTRYKNVLGNKDREIETLKKAQEGIRKSVDTERNRAKRLEDEKKKLERTMNEAEGKYSAMDSELEFLKGRNAVLLKKCESMVENQRTLQEKKEEAFREREALKRDTEIAQHELRLTMEQCKKLEMDLGATRYKESLWMRDRIEMEKKLAAKDVQLGTERRQWEAERVREREARERLEARLRSERPEEDAVMGIESLNRALEAVKTEFGEQMRLLTASVKPLRESLETQVAVQQSSERRASSEPR